MGKKRRVSRMGALVKLPTTKTNHSMTKWLNGHFGADINKAMNGDLAEKKKSERHFEKKTLEARSKHNDNSKR